MSKYTLAIAELLFIAPAGLFLAALFVRNLPPLSEPARAAQQAAQEMVFWYAMRPHVALWVLLIALPLAALGTGCGTLSRRWSRELELRQSARRVLAAIETHLETLAIAAATLAAAAILALVTLRMLPD